MMQTPESLLIKIMTSLYIDIDYMSALTTHVSEVKIGDVTTSILFNVMMRYSPAALHEYDVGWLEESLLVYWIHDADP